MRQYRPGLVPGTVEFEADRMGISSPPMPSPAPTPTKEAAELWIKIEAAIMLASTLGEDAYDAIEGRGLAQMRREIAAKIGYPLPERK